MNCIHLPLFLFDYLLLKFHHNLNYEDDILINLFDFPDPLYLSQDYSP